MIKDNQSPLRQQSIWLPIELDVALAQRIFVQVVILSHIIWVRLANRQTPKLADFAVMN
jgi:hypothetical protein